MKKFNAGGPGYGLFELTSQPRDGDMNLGNAGEATVKVSVAPWEPDFVRNLPRKHSFYRGIGKRVFDTAIVLAALPFAVPVIGIGAVALWFEGGSPFYTQERIGKDGEHFSILKLRTMVRDADAVLEDYLAADPEMRREWDELQKLKQDPRITRVGKFLRATSLDELPQIWNVLKGEMSFVGPRPMMPEQEQMYGRMRAYKAVRPGITGLWQVSARNGNTFRYRNQVDGAYERSLSFGNDLTILMKTVGVVLRGTGY